jgi:3-oxoacyl-[acyl-carrier protein] reductase
VVAGNEVITFARSPTAELRALAESADGRLSWFELDLTSAAAPAQAIARATEIGGPIDALIHCAAVGQDSLLAHTPDDEIESIVTLNVTRAIELSRCAVRSMMVSGGGTILNASSICATRGYAGISVYSASKGAMEAFTRAAARVLGQHGIYVNCIAPGFFASEMSASLSGHNLDTIARRTPTGKLTQIDQVVDACTPLIQARALNITGQVLTIDGGASV